MKPDELAIASMAQAKLSKRDQILVWSLDDELDPYDVQRTSVSIVRQDCGK